MKLATLLHFRMTPVQYLLYQSFGSVFVNGGINAGVMLTQYRGVPAVPLFGNPSILRDTVWSAVLLSALTCIIGTWFVRKDMRGGRVDAARAAREMPRWVRVMPGSLFVRGLISGVLFTVLSVPAVVGVLHAAGVGEMSYRAFFIFKVGFAAVLGMVVTPLNAARVIIQPSR